MARPKQCILNPIADAFTPTLEQVAGGKLGNDARAIGFIDNSKPNVSWLVEVLARELGTAGEPDIINVAKPRSAGPSPDIDFLAGRCRLVVNAVGD